MAEILWSLGILFILAGIGVKWGVFGWFGSLPGDLKFEGEHFVFFAPITSMLLISVVLSLILWLLQR